MLVFGPWNRLYSSPKTGQKSKCHIHEVRNPQSLWGTRSRFRGAALVHCYPKQSWSPCLAGDAYLPPPLHTRAHTFTLSAEEEVLKPQRRRGILTIELERRGEYSQHPHWGFSI